MKISDVLRDKGKDVVTIGPDATVGELLVWVLYAVPMTVYVLRPAKRPERAVESAPAVEPVA